MRPDYWKRDEIKNYFEFADIPPMNVYGYENMEEVTSEINSIIKRSFKLISEKIVVEYEEI